MSGLTDKVIFITVIVTYSNPGSTKHLHNMCTMLDQRQTLGRRCTNVVHMFYVYWEYTCRPIQYNHDNVTAVFYNFLGTTPQDNVKFEPKTSESLN